MALAVVLTNFKHPLDLTRITIFIPLQNTISAIVFESRETLLWIALYLSFFRKTVVTKYCFQVLLLLSRMCFFVCYFSRMINGCDITYNVQVQVDRFIKQCEKGTMQQTLKQLPPLKRFVPPMN